MAFYFVGRKMLASSQNLTHNVVSSVMVLRLTHFSGENVTECIFVLRNILKFLNYGKTGIDRTPPTIMENLFDVFVGCTNKQFQAYILSLRDFHRSTTNDPESLFLKAQTYYHSIISKPGTTWLIEKKRRAVLQAESSDNNMTSQSPQAHSVQGVNLSDIPALIKALQQLLDNNKKGKGPKEVDRTPPKQGEPTSRTNKDTGEIEHWCDKCIKGGRWGNHNRDGHDKWYENYKKEAEQRKKDKAAKKNGQEATEGASQPPSSMVKANQASTNFTSFISRNHEHVSFTEDSSDEES
jgi:hypothetical protein